MKAKDLFETFFNQIWPQKSQNNHPKFIVALFKAAGSEYKFNPPVAGKNPDNVQYPPSHYGYKIFNGVKPISSPLKNSFKDQNINESIFKVDGLTAYFERHIRMSANHCPDLMQKFGITEQKQDAHCLAHAMALQFKAFIDNLNGNEVNNIIAEEYSRLIENNGEVSLTLENRKQTIYELHGVDEADRLLVEAKGKEDDLALDYLLRALTLFKYETGEKSTDTIRTSKMIQDIYERSNSDEQFET